MATFELGEWVRAKKDFPVFSIIGRQWRKKVADVRKGEVAIVTGYNDGMTIFHIIRYLLPVTLEEDLWESRKEGEE
jgi:hypothetical protein